MEDENARAADAGRSGPETAILAFAGAAVGVCVVALVIAAGGFAAWAGPDRPPPATLLPWAAGDVKDDRIDFLVYRSGIAVAGATALLWSLIGLRRSVGRGFVAIPLIALAAVATPWLIGVPTSATAVAAAAVAACVAAFVAALRAPERGGGSAPADFAVTARSAGWADLAVLGCIVLVFAPLACDRRAAVLLAEDHFHHWDVFAMGPAVAARGGWSLLSDVPSMYGLGPPAVIDAAASALGGLTHVRAIEAAAWIETICVCVLFGALRLLGLRAAGAALVLALGVGFARFRLVQYPPNDLVRYPAGSVLRFLLDGPWLACVAWFALRGRRLALACAGLLAGGALWWITDTGIFLLAAHAGCVAVIVWRAAADARRGLIVAGLLPAFALAAAFVASQAESIRSGALWEQISLRTAGYAAFPAPALDLAHLGVYAAPLVFVALGTAALVRRSPLAPAAAGWAIYAAGCYHYYVGRSLLSSWARLAIVIAIACALFYLLCRRAHPAPAEAVADGAPRRPWARTVAMWAPGIAALVVCLATPRLVSRVAERFATDPPTVRAEGVEPVIPASADADVARALTSGIAEIRRLVPAGSAAAVISDHDVIYCLGADRRPFSPRLPLLHMTLTTAQLDDARRRLDDPAVEVVFVDATRPRFHWSRELLPVLREHVATTCDLVGRAGDLEVWRRRSAR